jgi:trehalose-phosphatase
VESETEVVGRQHSLRCIVGKQVSELRPPVDVNKGTAILDLARSLGIVGDQSAAARVGAALYVGDDRTDEDAFRLLRAARPDSVTVHVGGGTLATGEQTAAEFLVPDPQAVLRLLVWLTAAR